MTAEVRLQDEHLRPRESASSGFAHSCTLGPDRLSGGVIRGILAAKTATT